MPPFLYLNPFTQLLRPRQVARYYDIENRYQHQYTYPAGLTPRFSHCHPHDNTDHDINERNEQKNEPPQWFLCDHEHEEYIENRDPCKPCVLSICFLGDRLQSQCHVYIEYHHQNKIYDHHACRDPWFNLRVSFHEFHLLSQHY
jgi:hypothetical protein